MQEYHPSPVAEFLFFKMSLYPANIYVSSHISWEVFHAFLSSATSEMLPLPEEWRKRYFVIAAAILELLMHNYQSELPGYC